MSHAERVGEWPVADALMILFEINHLTEKEAIDLVKHKNDTVK